MNVWRIQLKPDKNSSITYKQLIEFCMENEVIGVGWTNLKERYASDEELRKACDIYADGGTGPTRAYKAIHAMAQMEEGDLVWSRLGEDASEYYLCRVDSETWKDCNIRESDQKKYDIGNAVKCKWIKVGKQDMVPGKVVNSFMPAAAVQRVNGVTSISTTIWNELSPSDYPKYPTIELTMDDFWQMIESEELECLILLYLQTLGYYIYSTTTKISNPKYEAVMIYKDGSHLAFPQVKRNEYLDPEKYSEGIRTTDRVFLFSSSESYGNAVENVTCITKKEIENFIFNNKLLLTDTLRKIVDKIFVE